MGKDRRSVKENKGPAGIRQALMYFFSYMFIEIDEKAVSSLFWRNKKDRSTAVRRAGVS
jgi:hypothetical protein